MATPKPITVLGGVDKFEIFVIPAKAGIYGRCASGHYWTQSAWISVQDRNGGVICPHPLITSDFAFSTSSLVARYSPLVSNPCNLSCSLPSSASNSPNRSSADGAASLPFVDVLHPFGKLGYAFGRGEIHVHRPYDELRCFRRKNYLDVRHQVVQRFFGIIPPAQLAVDDLTGKPGFSRGAIANIDRYNLTCDARSLLCLAPQDGRPVVGPTFHKEKRSHRGNLCASPRLCSSL